MNATISKLRTTFFSLTMYSYLLLVFANIVGMPNLSELKRCYLLGEPFFYPNLNLIPLADGITFGFLANILLFVPFGFFCPMLSKHYENAKSTILLGFGLSLFIECSQLFTLYRATDIDDLLTNTCGTAIGYLFFRLLVKLKIIKPKANASKKDLSRYLPFFIIAIAFFTNFFKPRNF